MTPPLRCKPIGLRWAYEVKMNSSGAIVRYTTILLVKSYVQNYDVDYEEVFAPMNKFIVMS